MPWDKKDYPASMKNLPGSVRDKAIDIANALVTDKNMDEGIAIATGISRAKDWAINNDKATFRTTPTDVKQHGEDIYVVPHNNKWLVKKEGNERGSYFDNKAEAVKVGKQRARDANASLTIQTKKGTIQDRYSYNPHNPYSRK